MFLAGRCYVGVGRRLSVALIARLNSAGNLGKPEVRSQEKSMPLRLAIFATYITLMLLSSAPSLALEPGDEKQPAAADTQSWSPPNRITDIHKVATPLQSPSARQEQGQSTTNEASSNAKVSETTSTGTSKPPPAVPVLKGNDDAPTATQMQEWNTPLKGFHPIKSVTRPIWKLRREVLDLQGNIVTLQRPMSGLQPAFNTLEDKMSQVDTSITRISDHLGALDKQMTQMENEVSGARKEMHAVVGIRNDLREMMKVREDLKEIPKIRGEMHQMGKQMKSLEIPLSQLQTPMVSLMEPIKGVHSNLSTLQQQMTSVQSQITDMRQDIRSTSERMKEMQAPMTAVCEPLNELRSELKELNSSLAALVRASMISVVAVSVAACIAVASVLYAVRSRSAK